MSEQVNTALEEAKTALDEVSETVKTEKETKKSKTETKKVSEKEKSETKEVSEEKTEMKSSELPKGSRKRGVPFYKVSELVADSRKRFKCSPEVATIAFQLQGKVDTDTMNITEARILVSAFLKKEVN